MKNRILEFILAVLTYLLFIYLGAPNWGAVLAGLVLSELAFMKSVE